MPQTDAKNIVERAGLGNNDELSFVHVNSVVFAE